MDIKVSEDASRKEDAALLRRVAGGDERACRHLVERDLPRALALAQRMLSDRAAAEDVAQEAFVRLWRAAGKWRPEARVATWLYRVVHNLCIDRLRANSRFVGELQHDPPDPTPDVLEMRRRDQLAAAVEAAIAGLPERQRTALTLVHHEGLAAAEVAQIMNISIQALESLLARGRRTLRSQLAPSRDDLLGDMG